MTLNQIISVVFQMPAFVRIIQSSMSTFLSSQSLQNMSRQLLTNFWLTIYIFVFEFTMMQVTCYHSAHMQFISFSRVPRKAQQLLKNNQYNVKTCTYFCMSINNLEKEQVCPHTCTEMPSRVLLITCTVGSVNSGCRHQNWHAKCQLANM